MDRDNRKLLWTEVPRTRECGVLARELLARHFGKYMDEQPLGNAKIVVAELVNNAYEHGRGRIDLKIQTLDGRIRIEVADEGSGALARVRRGPHRNRRRGLALVDDLSLSWGAADSAARVWAEVPVSDDRPPAADVGDGRAERDANVRPVVSRARDASRL